jgi:hypothetical protein
VVAVLLLVLLPLSGFASVQSDARSPEVTENCWNVFTNEVWQPQTTASLTKLE